MPTLRFTLVSACLGLGLWAMVNAGGLDTPERVQRFDQPPQARFLINAALTGTMPRARHFTAEQLSFEIAASLRDPTAYYQ